MRKEVFFGLFGLIGISSLAFNRINKKKDAETIGDYLGMGMDGISYDLPNGKVLKIIDLKENIGTLDEKQELATFMNYYAIMTENGTLKPNKHLPTIYFFQAGYANRQLEEEILDEMPNDAWRNNIIEYNTPVAMWVVDKYDDWNDEDYSHPKYRIGSIAHKEDLDEARNNLMNWFEENNLGVIDDLHIDNYGFDDKGNIVFFDFGVRLPLNGSELTRKILDS